MAVLAIANSFRKLCLTVCCVTQPGRLNNKTDCRIFPYKRVSFKKYFYLDAIKNVAWIFLHEMHLSATMIKTSTSLFPSDFKSVFVWHLTGKILSFEFCSKAVFFECKFRISRSTFVHVQNWPIGLQRVGLRIRWRQRLTSLKLQHVNAAHWTCKTCI